MVPNPIGEPPGGNHPAGGSRQAKPGTTCGDDQGPAGGAEGAENPPADPPAAPVEPESGEGAELPPLKLRRTLAQRVEKLTAAGTPPDEITRRLNRRLDSEGVTNWRVGIDGGELRVRHLNAAPDMASLIAAFGENPTDESAGRLAAFMVAEAERRGTLPPSMTADTAAARLLQTARGIH